MSPAGWWQNSEALKRFVCDLVAGELSRMRPGGAPLPAAPWAPGLELGGGGLGADSLELLALAAALSEAIHLHESGIEDYLLARRTIGEWVEIAAAGLDRFHAELSFRTSGSTGAPKTCTHPLALLEQEIEAQSIVLGRPRRIVSAVPSHHIYGFLFTILLPHRLGGVPVIDIRGRSPAALAFTLGEGDLIIGHPDFWRALVRALPHMRSGVVGVTSTAPCPRETAEAVAGRGLSRLVQIYGSTETGGIAWREAPEAPYLLYPHWHRAAPDMVARLLPAGGGERRYVLPDDLEWLGARHFRLAGRRDAAVQVGGINVFPARVRQVLCDHPFVKDAAVRLMHPEEGGRLKAFIVPVEGIDPRDLRAALTDWIDRQLSTPERPRSLTFGAELPVSGLGKAADWPASATGEPDPWTGGAADGAG